MCEVQRAEQQPEVNVSHRQLVDRGARKGDEAGAYDYLDGRTATKEREGRKGGSGSSSAAQASSRSRPPLPLAMLQHNAHSNRDSSPIASPPTALPAIPPPRRLHLLPRRIRPWRRDRHLIHQHGDNTFDWQPLWLGEALVQGAEVLTERRGKAVPRDDGEAARGVQDSLRGGNLKAVRKQWKIYRSKRFPEDKVERISASALFRRQDSRMERGRKQLFSEKYTTRKCEWEKIWKWKIVMICERNAVCQGRRKGIVQ